MRNFFKIPIMAAALFVASACADSITTAERLTLANNAIETTAKVSKTALVQGNISIQDACRIVTYGELARAAIDAGFQAYVANDAEGAAAHLKAAQNILNGVSTEAAAQVEKECN